MAGPDLHGLASDLLDVVSASFAANGRPVQPRSFVAEGAVAADDVSLCVQVIDVRYGSPARPHSGPIQTAVGYSVDLVVWSFRSAAPFDGEDLPTAEAINASGIEILADGAAILEAVRTFARARSSTSWGGMTFPGPSGGLAVCRAALTTEP